MPKIDLTATEFETVLYALGVAEADLIESANDPTQSEEDRKEWVASLAETRAVLAKLEPLAEDAAA
jgi:hypothetical protein